jgi:phospholipid transport system substrate-binding protein
MKKFFLIIILTVVSLNSSLAVTYNSNPKIFITELVGDAIKILSDKSINKKNKAEAIEKIALAHVDIKALGMYTLGNIRKNLDENTLDEYNKLFEDYFLVSLTSRLTDYASDKFEVISEEQKSSSYTIVQSKITESLNQPEIKIDWRVYTKDPLKPLIRDLIVEGLSLARTQREEFSSILGSNNNDIKILFVKLKEFASKK